MSSQRTGTRERILDSAWRRLERGTVATLAEVAADAGVSRQAVYLHFGSRGGLLRALVAHIDERLGLMGRIAQVQAVVDPAKRLQETLALTASYQREIHGPAMAMVRVAAQDEDVRAALEDRMEHRRADLARTIEELARAGRLRAPWSATEVTDALWELGAPTTYEHLVVERGWPPERYRDWLLWAASSFLCAP